MIEVSYSSIISIRAEISFYDVLGNGMANAIIILIIMSFMIIDYIIKFSSYNIAVSLYGKITNIINLVLLGVLAICYIDISRYGELLVVWFIVTALLLALIVCIVIAGIKNLKNDKITNKKQEKKEHKKFVSFQKGLGIINLGLIALIFVSFAMSMYSGINGSVSIYQMFYDGVPSVIVVFAILIYVLIDYIIKFSSSKMATGKYAKVSNIIKFVLIGVFAICFVDWTVTFFVGIASIWACQCAVVLGFIICTTIEGVKNLNCSESKKVKIK